MRGAYVTLLHVNIGVTYSYVISSLVLHVCMSCINTTGLVYKHSCNPCIRAFYYLTNQLFT